MRAPPRCLGCGSSSRGARPSSNSLASALPMRPSIQCRLPVTRGARRRPSARSTAVGPGGFRPRNRRPSGPAASLPAIDGRRAWWRRSAHSAAVGARLLPRPLVLGPDAARGRAAVRSPPRLPARLRSARRLPNLVEAPRRPRRPAASVRTLGGRRGAAVALAAALSTRSAARVERRFGRRRALRPAPDGSIRPRGGSPLPAAPTGSARSAAVGTRPSRRPLLALLSCLVMHGKKHWAVIPCRCG